MNLATISICKRSEIPGFPFFFFLHPMQDLALPSEWGGHCVKELLK